MKGLLETTTVFKAATFVIITASASTINLASQSTKTTTVACVCDPKANNYNADLPVSHPSNRCSNESSDLSWTGWLAGESQTNQLHFIDLFELLYGHNNDNAPLNTSTTSP